MASNAGLSATRQALQCMHEQKRRAAGIFVRRMATEVDTPSTHPASRNSTLTGDKSTFARATPAGSSSAEFIHPLQHVPPANPFITPAQCMLYSFPDFEPTRLTAYPSTHLLLPLRKDILHKAIVFEADAAREGTANTKWRDDVHGSGRKIRPQKGTGRARLGDRKSPMLRGGGVAFGPKPRDFSTDLPRKLYDLAWRTALSYRYRRGQLLVLDGEAGLEMIYPDSRPRYMADLLKFHDMGHEQRRTLLVTDTLQHSLTEAFEEEKTRWEAEYLQADDVRVKNLLELGRVVIEKRALDRLLARHEADLSPWQHLGAWTHSQDSVRKQPLSISTSV